MGFGCKMALFRGLADARPAKDPSVQSLFREILEIGNNPDPRMRGLIAIPIAKIEKQFTVMCVDMSGWSGYLSLLTMYATFV